MATQKWVTYICDTAENNGGVTVKNEKSAAGDDRGPVYETSTEEILKQARFTADLAERTKCGFTMSTEVWKNYKYAYKNRMRYSAWYAAKQQADDGQAYSITMMEKVQQQLIGCVKIQELSRAALKSAKGKRRLPNGVAMPLRRLETSWTGQRKMKRESQMILQRFLQRTRLVQSLNPPFSDMNKPLKQQALVGMINFREEGAFLRRTNVTLSAHSLCIYR
ncbi:uncharacterized protein N0V89_007090 [Didymosphaeria variabile]|uniref:Uncharacterized protein n=1 Tax=Didymosphaeria variabile TaxID=1932322 RepID=A0A9W9CA56_9PLEO|nr:uncharacterized protein N0V89_007090 [Didymosphaeria variabile]KAJ4351747.1 hypothetical protein N0V89_007090 [Didymosphaeria variabile]